MKPGKYKNIIILILSISLSSEIVFAEEKIQSVPLINLEELSPTFEEDKDELESTLDKKSINIEGEENTELFNSNIDDKVYVNMKALDKITAKISNIRLAIGKKEFFGPLEIQALKCSLSNYNEITDTVAYIQVKDLSLKDNNSVFLFNGWTFASNPTLRSIDHPVYDLWITGCENI